MGSDISSFAEFRENTKWIRVVDKVFPDGRNIKSAEPFNHRSYALFGFLANVRNYSVSPYFERKGLPDDSVFLNTEINDGWGGSVSKKQDILDDSYHSCSWLSLKELVEFDYSQTMEDRRTVKEISQNHFNSAHIVEPGEGVKMTVKEFLTGTGFFKVLDVLKTLGKEEDVRIVFWFS